jgi:hypothetical protein
VWEWPNFKTVLFLLLMPCVLGILIYRNVTGNPDGASTLQLIGMLASIAVFAGLLYWSANTR